MLKMILLILAVCTDSFAASIGLGSAGIKIPVKSAAIISITGTLFLTFSVYFSNAAESIIPMNICSTLSFFLLIGLGVFNIFQNAIKKKVNAASHKNGNNPLKVYCDETSADTDNSKSISSKEALILAIALSADSLITGISAGFVGFDIPLLAVMTFIIGFAAVKSGSMLGSRISAVKKLNIGWLGGILLIVLAFLR